MKVYIVSGYDVYGDIAYDWHVKGFYNEEDAVEFCSFLNDKANKLWKVDVPLAQSKMKEYDIYYIPLVEYNFSPCYHVTSVEIEE